MNLKTYQVPGTTADEDGGVRLTYREAIGQSVSGVKWNTSSSVGRIDNKSSYVNLTVPFMWT